MSESSQSTTNQAVLRIVPNGPRSEKALRNLLEYAVKNERAELIGSRRYQDLPIPREEIPDLVREWVAGVGAQRPREGERESEHPIATHIVISFPRNTNRDAAERTVRRWTRTVFESGEVGREFDYLSAFHNDTGSPHAHIVVNRRAHGAEAAWLSISQVPRTRTSRRSAQFSYQELRHALVQAANLEGIALHAGPHQTESETEWVPDPELDVGSRGSLEVETEETAAPEADDFASASVAEPGPSRNTRRKRAAAEQLPNRQKRRRTHHPLLDADNSAGEGPSRRTPATERQVVARSLKRPARIPAERAEEAPPRKRARAPDEAQGTARNVPAPSTPQTGEGARTTHAMRTRSRTAAAVPAPRTEEGREAGTTRIIQTRSRTVQAAIHLRSGRLVLRPDERKPKQRGR